jgi:hypothetical protein
LIPPIVVKESSSISETGDVTVFATASHLEAYFEPWYVDESHFIFDSTGRQLEITANENCVRLTLKDPSVFHPDLVCLYFTRFLKTIAAARGWDYAGVTEEFLQTATLPELVSASMRFATK